MQTITEQTSNEHLYLLHTEANGRDVCHYILVPYDKMSSIKKYVKGEYVDIENCYRLIEYRDENGKVRRASFFGREPPEYLTTWINQQYGKLFLLTTVISICHMSTEANRLFV